MPQAVAVVWNAAAAIFSGTAFGASTSTAIAVANAGVQVAANVALALAVNSVVANNTKPKDQGGLIDLTLDSAAPRRMIVGKRMTGGVLVDWYLAGSNNTKLYLPVYLSEGPCGQITRVFAGGREVWSTPLVHGVRTTIPDFRSGGDRLWLTYYDGREGQSADATLVALSQGWTSANKMTGCAWVLIECQWDSDNLRQPPQLTFEMEGATLYDRRKDTTAGGSGSHRIDDPSTWEWSDNPMVALDHFLLGRYWDGRRTFGIGLSADEVPYDYFAAQANVCDEDVDLNAGGTQKRYRANGFIFANDDYASTIGKLCDAMAARAADFGGRFGVIGIESKTPVLTIDDADLIAGTLESYTPKRSWSDLVGAVEGRYQDPAQLYQPVDFPRVTDAAWEAEDGGEPKVLTLDLEFEVNVERAQRLALLKARAERRQAMLRGVYPLWTIELERGDWFIRTGAKWGEGGKTFEVIERILDTENYTVSIVAQEVDAADSAWDESTAQDGPPAPIASTDELSAVAAPVLTVTSNPIAGAASNTPAIKVAFTNPTDPRVISMFIEVVRDSDGLKVATVPVTIPDADEEVIIQNGIADGVDYTVQAKFLTPGLSSDWSDPEGVTTGATYVGGTADSVEWENVQDGGGTRPDDNADVTSANTAAGITGQGDLATANRATLAFGVNGVVNSEFQGSPIFGWASTLRGWEGSSGITPVWSIVSGDKRIGQMALTGTPASGTGADLLDQAYAPGFPTNLSRVCLPVQAGDRIALSALVAGQGLSNMIIQAFWLDDNGDYLGEGGAGSGAVAIDGSSGDLTAYERRGGFLTVPSGVKYARFGVRAVFDGTTNPKAWATSPFIAIVPAGQTTLPPYSPGPPDRGANSTGENTAAAILGQGAFATLSSVAYGSGYLTGFGTLAALSNALGLTAGGITGQGAFATLNTINSSGLIDAGVVVYTALSSTAVRLGTNITRADGSTSLTDALAVTSLGTAAAIASQGGLATLSFVTIGTNLRRADGTTSATESLIVTSLGTASAITGQGDLATTNKAALPFGANACVNSEFISSYGWGANGLAWDGNSGLTITRSKVSGERNAFYATAVGTPNSGEVFDLMDSGYGGSPRFLLPVVPGDRIGASVLLAAQGCAGVYIHIGWSDDDGAYLSEEVIASATPNVDGSGGDPTTYVLASGVLTVPSGVRRVRMWVRATSNGTANPKAWAMSPMLCRLPSGQTTVPPYSPGPPDPLADQTLANTAAAITSQGGLATLNFATLGTNVRLADGTTVATNALLVTSLGVASSVTGQGALCTLSYVQFNSTVRLQDGTTIVTDALVVTASGTAAAIASQGALATLNAVGTSQISSGAVTGADDDETDAGQNVGASWVAVADCSLTTVDAASRALIMFSAYIESSTDGSLMEARIKRDSTVIWGPKSIAGDPPEFSETFEDEGLIEYRPMFNGMVSFFDTDVPGAAAAYTYTVELRVAGSVTTPWVASYRRMFGMIFKR